MNLRRSGVILAWTVGIPVALLVVGATAILLLWAGAVLAQWCDWPIPVGVLVLVLTIAAATGFIGGVLNTSPVPSEGEITTEGRP